MSTDHDSSSIRPFYTTQVTPFDRKTAFENDWMTKCRKTFIEGHVEGTHVYRSNESKAFIRSRNSEDSADGVIAGGVEG